MHMASGLCIIGALLSMQPIESTLTVVALLVRCPCACCILLEVRSSVASTSTKHDRCFAAHWGCCACTPQAEQATERCAVDSTCDAVRQATRSSLMTETDLQISDSQDKF